MLIERNESFKDKIFSILQLLLETDAFNVSGKKNKIFRDKYYTSADGKKTIRSEISIETYLNNEKDFILLTLVEYKNHFPKVTINYIEDFAAKIKKIGGDKTKGMFISSNSFQRDSIKLAKSLGLTLVRIRHKNKFEWIVKENETEITSNISIDKFQTIQFDKNISFISINENFIYFNLVDLLIALGFLEYFEYRENLINIPFVSNDKIDFAISKIEKYNVYKAMRLDEIEICKFLEDKYGVVFDLEAELENEILGEIEFNPLVIRINKTLKNNRERFRFTLAHEIGHLILHYVLLKNKIKKKIDTDSTMSFKYYVDDLVARRIEIQASVFAAHLLLPKNSFNKFINDYFVKESIYKPYLLLDSQTINKRVVMNLVTQISESFQVSKELAKVRLVEIERLKDKEFKNLRGMLRGMKFIK